MNWKAQFYGTLAAVPLIALMGLFLWWRMYGAEEWQRRYYYPVPVGDGCQLLDQTMGGHARDPQALLETIAWDFEVGPNLYKLGQHEVWDAQHQALIRLLD